MNAKEVKAYRLFLECKYPGKNIWEGYDDSGEYYIQIERNDMPTDVVTYIFDDSEIDRLMKT